MDQVAWMTWLKPAAILAGAWLAGWVIKLVVLRQLEKFTAKTETPLDDVIMGLLRRYIILWCVLLGLVMAAKIAPLSAAIIGWINKGTLAIIILSVSWALAELFSYGMEYFGKKRSLELSTLSLTQNLLKLAVLLMGVMLILSNLGISIAPLLTALGVGSLAVALALQDTLSNLFAGFYMIVSQHMKAGDYVQLDSGQEGYVADIGWRSCTIRQLAGNLVIVPNNKLAQAIIINYYKPGKDLAVLVNLGVAYESDLNKVEAVTVEVAAKIMREVAGGVPDFKPFIRYNNFGDSSIGFTVILRGKEFADRYLITHEFMKALHARYQQEGIGIPFPQRVVHLQK